MYRKLFLSLLVILCAGLSLLVKPLQVYFQPMAIIVPHHDAVAKTRSEYINKISGIRPQTNSVVILSPDHFSRDQKQIFYSDAQWNLYGGTLEYDADLGSKLTPTAVLNREFVRQDHGIFNLLTDIKKYFPESQIVPMLIGQKVSTQKLDLLSESLARFCRNDCLLVASVDFSHYLPAALADIHDLYSQQILEHLDTGNYQNLEVDSPQSLYLAMQFAKARDTTHYNLFSHTNSGHLMGNPDMETTSHIMTSYSRQIAKKEFSKSTTFTIANGLKRITHQKTVGDRFFYGVDYLDPEINSAYSPSPGIEIIPATTSSVIVTDNQVRVEIGRDLTVSGTISPTGSSILFLPLDASTSSFLRGQEKSNYLRNLFAKVTDSRIMLDTKSGIINLR